MSPGSISWTSSSQTETLCLLNDVDNSGPDTVVFIPLHSNKLNLGKGEMAEIPDDSKGFGFV